MRSTRTIVRHQTFVHLSCSIDFQLHKCKKVRRKVLSPFRSYSGNWNKEMKCNSGCIMCFQLIFTLECTRCCCVFFPFHTNAARLFYEILICIYICKTFMIIQFCANTFFACTTFWIVIYFKGSSLPGCTRGNLGLCCCVI